jgi:hypothetical protein
MRETGVTPMERKAWIDYNFDADFIDAGELIMSESNGTNPTGEAFFTIPNSLTPGRVTRLRVGVSEGGTTLTPDKARSGCFEDYGIEIGLDLVPPTIRLNGPSVYRVQRNTSYVDPGVIATDNREGDISARFEMSSNIDMTQVGVYKARYWVKDLYGNVSDTIERTIQVEVNQVGPSVTLVGADTIRMEVRSPYVELGATAVDNVGNNITSRIARIGMVDTANIGIYYVNYSVNDAFGYTGEKTRVVIVRKTSKPTISSITSNGIWKHQIFTPYLNAQGILPRDGFFPVDQLTITRVGSVNESVPGSYTVQYTACDPIGNCSDPFLLQVDVQDTVPPVVTLLGPNPLIVDVYNDNFEDPGISASDNYFSSNSLIRITQRNVNTNKLGTYNITYIVKDGSGNTTTLVRTVNIVDRVAPTIEVLGGSPYDQPRFKDFVDPGIRIIDNYDSESELRATLVVTSNLANRNDTLWADLDGWRYVRYQVTDKSGNVSAVAERLIRVLSTGLNEEVITGELNVYPNPSNGKFEVKAQQPLTGNTEVILYNMLGAKVYSNVSDIQGSTIEMNVQGLTTGIYLLQVNTGDKIYTQRITIK